MATNIEAFQEYLRLEKKYSLHTIVAYSNDVQSFAEFISLHSDQDGIDFVMYSQIRAWVVALVEQSVTNVSINRKIASLKAFYRFLLKTKQIQINPLLGHKALKTPKSLQIPFSEKEMFVALGHEENEVGFEAVRNKLIVEMFYATGIRRAELIGLKVKDVNLITSTIKVLGKRNKERIVPVVPSIKAQLSDYLACRTDLVEVLDEDYFFLTKKGLKLNESFVYRLINSYFSTVSEKLKKSPHILRHTFATHLLNNGADLNSVKELLGHASLASTQVYTHSSLAELQKVHKNAHPRGRK